MATNKYKGNSSAYGVGRFFEEMEGRKESFHNPIVQAQGSYGSGTSSTTSNPVQSISNNEIGANAGSQAIQNLTSTYGIPTSMNNAIDLRNKSVKGGVDGGYDFYQQGINKQGAGGDIYSNFDASNWDMNSKAGVDMTSNFGSNLEVGKTLSSNPAGTEKPWYGSLPNTSGQTNYDPLAPKPKLSRTVTEEDLDRIKDISGAKDAFARRQRSITGPDSMYKAKVHQSSGTSTSYAGKESQSFDGVYEPKWGKEKVDLNRFASYDSGKRFSEEEVQGNLAEATRNKRDEWKKVVQDKYGAPDSNAAVGMSFDREMALQAKKGPDHSGQSGMVSMDSMKDDLSSLWDQDIEDPFSVGEDIAGSLTPNSVVDSVPGEVSTLGKVGSTLGKAGEAIGKAAPYIAAGANALSTFSQMDRRSGVIDDLGKGVNRVESMIGNMANQEHAESRAMVDEYAEGNRRIGEGQNLQLGNRLDAVKGSNLNTGSIKRIKEDLTDDFQRTTDLSLASAATAFEKQTDQFHADSRDTRAKANEELKQLREELKEQERQQAMAPFSLAADLAIGVVGASNPLLGMGLSAVKNKAFA
jgi:hypothetical protein|tara:strand:+ start:617 stop:2359 length:1743 start_codon:yes stop_codon:yes gene_type:complete